MRKPEKGYHSAAYALMSKYNLTVEQFHRMYLNQRGLCAICGKRMIDRDCHVDHDHATGKVRALLCGTCNTGLGLFKDKIRLLARAIVYLEEHGKEY